MKKVFLFSLLVLAIFSCKEKSNPIINNENPVITKITPDSIFYKMKVTILGTSLGNSYNKDYCSVYFDNIKADSIVNWTADSIVAIVPYIKKDGKIKIEYNGQKSNEIPYFFKYDIVITRATSIEGWFGEVFEVFGTNFGEKNSTSKLRQYHYPDYTYSDNEIILWTDTLIRFKIPPISGRNYMFVQNNGKSSNQLFVLFYPLPTLTSLSPNNVSYGDVIRIYGKNLCYWDSKPEYFIIDGIKFQNIISKGEDVFDLVVPYGVKSGKIKFKIRDIESNELEYNIIPEPIVESMTPTTASEGDIISIKGKNFGDNYDKKYIMFGDTKITYYYNWSDSLIEFVVPNDAMDCNVYLTNNIKNYKNFQFKIQRVTPNIDDLMQLNKIKFSYSGYIDLNSSLILSKTDSGLVYKSYNLSLRINPTNLDLLNFYCKGDIWFGSDPCGGSGVISNFSSKRAVLFMATAKKYIYTILNEQDGDVYLYYYRTGCSKNSKGVWERTETSYISNQIPPAYYIIIYKN